MVLALGAPRGTEDTRIPFGCPACGAADLRLEADGAGLAFGCPACGAAHTPAPCPACDGEELRGTLDDAGAPVVVCADCGATYDSPPLEG